MQPLAQAIIATDFPTPNDTTPAPTPPPTVPPVTPDPAPNLLVNGSFDQGWTDDDLNPATQQNPKGWLLRWNLTDTSPYSGQPYLLGEGVHKNAFPPDEQDDFLWDGPWTYKVFAADRPFWARLKQLLDLPAGRYVLKTPVWCDCYRWDKTNKRKDYAIEPHHAQIMVKVTDRIVADWRNLTPGRRNDVETVIDHPGGVFDLAVHFRCHWGIGNNLFVNGWSLAAVAEPAPEPPPFRPHPAQPDAAGGGQDRRHLQVAGAHRPGQDEGRRHHGRHRARRLRDHQRPERRSLPPATQRRRHPRAGRLPLLRTGQALARPAGHPPVGHAAAQHPPGRHRPGGHELPRGRHQPAPWRPPPPATTPCRPANGAPGTSGS